jgi:hypothetical protein
MKAKYFVACLMFAVLGVLLRPHAAHALVKMDEGRLTINGIQLLQDYADPKAYYYVPAYPRLATNDDGTLNFLCLKYVDPKGKTGGGLFHALIEFSLPPEIVADIEKKLKTLVGGARLVGPVPLMQAEAKEGEDVPGSFEVVSAVLKNTGDGGLTRSLVTSGKAPITPGSRAAIAAILNQQGATLLWDSLSGPTSDVSVAINAYYEAMVTGFDARITANVSTIYTHFSSLSNVQGGYDKRQIRDVVDTLRRNGDIKVEVLDRTKGLDLKAGDMQALVDQVSNKIIEVMFDSKTGFSADPPRETAVEQGQIAGRQKAGWLLDLISVAKDQPYYTDNQFVLKNRKDVRQNTFSIILTKNSTVKVPVNTAGNLHGLYDAFKTDKRYFRVVNLGDATFEFRPVYFQVDGEYAGSFQDALNFVAVNFRKKFEGQPEYTGTVRFNQDTIKDGKLAQEVTYPRLGVQDATWLDYEYQVVWSVHNRKTVKVPADGGKWIKANDPAISLVPPLDKTTMEIDADRGKFTDSQVVSASMNFDYPLIGENKRTRVTLRATDTASTSPVTIYKDHGSKVKTSVTWFFKDGHQATKDLGDGDDTYFVLVPPAAGP